MKKITTTLFAFSFFIFLIINQQTQAQVPVWNWATGAGGFSMAHDKGQSVMTDQSGNLYVTGYYYSPTISFDSLQLVNTSVNFKADIFLVKYDPAGNLLWAKTPGGTDNDLSLSCTVDPVGNIIIAGYFTPVLIL